MGTIAECCSEAGSADDIHVAMLDAASSLPGALRPTGAPRVAELYVLRLIGSPHPLNNGSTA